METDFTKYVKTLDVDRLSKESSNLNENLSDNLEQQLKEYYGKLEHNLSESIGKGGYAMVYNFRNRQIKKTETKEEYFSLINGTALRDTASLFVKPDGNVVDKNIKVELQKKEA